MKCEWVRQNILLYVYDELQDDTRYELEQHVGRCQSCAAELDSIRDFRGAMSQVPVQDPSPNLLANSRMRLQEALEITQQGGFWRRFIFDPAQWLYQLRFSPALAAIIFIVGFSAGIGSTYKMFGGGLREKIISDAPAAQASITGIRAITQEPGSGQISIKYDTVTTEQAQGSMNDQRIQQLLLFAARNNYNSGVRMDSVDLLSKQSQDDRVREALLYALRYDTNPGVRLKALGALGPFVKEDVRVRNGLLEALENDSNPGVRQEALHLLDPVKADSSVRAVLEGLSKGDPDQFIRSQTSAELAQLPEID